ncbi:MAG: VOC family protein [Actinobacteria bacterium]|nr:VOC family protein [Actinomycetota bacterium]
MSHIGVVVEDLDQATAEWCERYGLVNLGGEVVEVEGVRNAFLSAGPSREEAACIELIEPLDKSDMSNAIARFLANKGEGLYHVAFFVDDPTADGEKLREHGVVVIDREAHAEGERARAVIHPKSANGLMLELL